MSLPAPNLDNRKFQQIVDEVKSQIGLRCPEWTDHNVSDPGVTLLELFSYMTEMMLFQLNQVPDKNYIKFLELLGVRLEMPRPANADLRYLLTRFIEDSEEGEGHGVTIPKDSVAATLRTETEDPIEFLTDYDLRLARPRLAHVLSLPSGVEAVADPDRSDREKIREYDLTDQARYQIVHAKNSTEKTVDNSFPIFGEVSPGFSEPRAPVSGDRLLFGFESDVSGHVVELVFQCSTDRASRKYSGDSNQVWQYWDSETRLWKSVTPLIDETEGFVESGVVRLELPHRVEARVVAGRRAFWIQCLYTLDRELLPVRPDRFGEREDYSKSPSIFGLRARTIGGQVRATHCTRIYDEVLGESDGKPGQRFLTRFSPVHRLDPKTDVVRTGPPNDREEEIDWLEWKRVEDFSESGPGDRHFVCDELTGEILFGPQIERPDGKDPDRHGAIPTKGDSVVLAAYRIGGGTLGNVREGRICVDKGSLQYIAEVSNPMPAHSGRDMESLDRAKMGATRILKVRNRAVTKEDFEELAREIHGVGRVWCLQPLHPTAYTGPEVPTGTVELLIVPALGNHHPPKLRELVLPADLRQRVQAHLDERRLLTSRLTVREPRFVMVETDIRLVSEPHLDPELVTIRVRERLNRFLDPLVGGFDGKGWPFGRALGLTDLYVQLSDNLGVALLLDVQITAYRVGRPSDPKHAAPEKVDLLKGLILEQDEVLCSRQHNLRIVPPTVREMRNGESGR